MAAAVMLSTSLRAGDGSLSPRESLPGVPGKGDQLHLLAADGSDRQPSTELTKSLVPTSLDWRDGAAPRHLCPRIS